MRPRTAKSIWSSPAIQPFTSAASQFVIVLLSLELFIAQVGIMTWMWLALTVIALATMCINISIGVRVLREERGIYVTR